MAEMCGAPTNLRFRDGKVVDTKTGLEVATVPFRDWGLIAPKPVEWESPHEAIGLIWGIVIGSLATIIFHGEGPFLFGFLSGLPLPAAWSYWKFRRQPPAPEQLDFYSQDAEMRAAMLEVDELYPAAPRISPEKVMVPKAIPAGTKCFPLPPALPKPAYDLFEKVWK